MKECFVIVDVKAGDVFETILTAQDEDQARAAFHMEWEHLSKNDQKDRQSFILVKAMVQDGIVIYETSKMVEIIK